MKNNTTVKLTGMLLLGVMLASACTQTYSQTPLGTPTLIPTSFFVSPIAGGQDPLKVVTGIGTQTAAAKTALAGGNVVAGTNTPGAAVTVSGATATPAVGTQAPAATTPVAITVVPGGSTFTPTTQAGTGSTVVAPTFSGTVPSTYTLEKGEWPYCIARRYNVNPNELLARSGLSADQSSILMPGRVLTMPQTGDPFPGPRAWHNHPDSFTVDSSDTTVSGVACYYGDLDPQSIATANNLSLGSILTAGQVLKIP